MTVAATLIRYPPDGISICLPSVKRFGLRSRTGSIVVCLRPLCSRCLRRHLSSRTGVASYGDEMNEQCDDGRDGTPDHQTPPLVLCEHCSRMRPVDRKCSCTQVELVSCPECKTLFGETDAEFEFRFDHDSGEFMCPECWKKTRDL